MLSKRVVPTGVDIEVISEKVDRIRSKFLRPEELADIPDDRNRLAKLLAVAGIGQRLIQKALGLANGVQLRVTFADVTELVRFTEALNAR